MGKHEAGFFHNPTEAQKLAIEQFNHAVLWLALNFGVDELQLGESVGQYTEEIISVLADGRQA